MKIGIFHNLSVIDPFNNSSSLSDNLVDLVFDALVQTDPEGKIIPSISDQWSFNQDKLEWDFHIRNDVYFHDGSKLNIEDVLYSLNRVFNSNTDLLSIFNSSVEKISIKNNDHIIFQLNKNDPWFLQCLQASKIVPSKYFTNAGSQQAFYQHPIGSGPFKVLEQNSSKIVLQAYKSFHNPKPLLNKIEVIAFENENAVFNQLVSQKIDLIFLLSPQDYGALESIKDLKIYENWYPMLYSIFFNFKDPIFQDLNLKEALDLAINKKRIIHEVFFDHGTCSTGTEMKDCNSDYDPAFSKEILSKSGWKISKKSGLLEKGNKILEFKIYAMEGDIISLESLKRIKEDFLEIGVKIDIVTLEPLKFFETVFKQKEFDLSFHMSVFRPYFHNEYAYFHSSQIKNGINISSYKNPTLDSILEKYSQNPEDKENFQNLQNILKKEKPALFLFWRKMPIVVHKKFKGIATEHMETLRDLIYVYEEQ